MADKPKILIVDDEDSNLQIITDFLTGDGYDVIGIKCGTNLINKLEENPDIDVIIIDLLKQHAGSINLLEKLKADAKFRDIPIIMQTNEASNEEILNGIKAGVFYYLTKPYQKIMLLSIVKSALQSARNKKEMRNELRKHKSALGMMVQSRFYFRTLEEAQHLAYFVSSCFPDPDVVGYGLIELLINAIEHGNLGISYEEKTKLVLNGIWMQEVEHRLGLPENKDKFSYLLLDFTNDNIKIHVKDRGDGFDWQKYLEISPERVTIPNGRGIATARMTSFDTMQYLGSGNEVVCTVALPKDFKFG